jgi:hypothetical protein
VLTHIKEIPIANVVVWKPGSKVGRIGVNKDVGINTEDPLTSLAKFMNLHALVGYRKIREATFLDPIEVGFNLISISLQVWECNLTKIRLIVWGGKNKH